MRENLAESFHI